MTLVVGQRAAIVFVQTDLSVFSTKSYLETVKTV